MSNHTGELTTVLELLSRARSDKTYPIHGEDLLLLSNYVRHLEEHRSATLMSNKAILDRAARAERRVYCLEKSLMQTRQELSQTNERLSDTVSRLVSGIWPRRS